MNTSSEAAASPKTARRGLVVTVALAAVLVAALVVVRLGGDSSPAKPAPATPAAPAATVAPLPKPTGDVVLKVAGVRHGNVAASITKADFAALDGVAKQRVLIREPFIKKNVTFTGITLGELLERAGVSATTGSIKFHALDDYAVTLPLAGAADALIATRANGELIPVAKGGPIRLVFTNDSSLAHNTDNWIWSIDSIRVTK
jgi:hypothetical protein